MPQTSSSPANASEIEDFLALSQILTGAGTLDADIGSQYLDRLNSSPLTPNLRQILNLFSGFKDKPDAVDKVKKQIVADPSFRPTVCQIILLWYTSAAQDNLGVGPPAAPTLRYGTQEQFFSGLAWTIMGAHPPGLSGGYFGHWRYRPDNEPEEVN